MTGKVLTIVALIACALTARAADPVLMLDGQGWPAVLAQLREANPGWTIAVDPELTSDTLPYPDIRRPERLHLRAYSVAGPALIDAVAMSTNTWLYRDDDARTITFRALPPGDPVTTTYRVPPAFWQDMARLAGTPQDAAPTVATTRVALARLGIRLPATAIQIPDLALITIAAPAATHTRFRTLHEQYFRHIVEVETTIWILRADRFADYLATERLLSTAPDRERFEAGLRLLPGVATVDVHRLIRRRGTDHDVVSRHSREVPDHLHGLDDDLFLGSEVRIPLHSYVGSGSWPYFTHVEPTITLSDLQGEPGTGFWTMKWESINILLESGRLELVAADIPAASEHSTAVASRPIYMVVAENRSRTGSGREMPRWSDYERSDPTPADVARRLWESATRKALYADPADADDAASDLAEHAPTGLVLVTELRTPPVQVGIWRPELDSPSAIRPSAYFQELDTYQAASLLYGHNHSADDVFGDDDDDDAPFDIMATDPDLSERFVDFGIQTGDATSILYLAGAETMLSLSSRANNRAFERLMEPLYCSLPEHPDMLLTLRVVVEDPALLEALRVSQPSADAMAELWRRTQSGDGVVVADLSLANMQYSSTMTTLTRARRDYRLTGDFAGTPPWFTTLAAVWSRKLYLNRESRIDYIHPPYTITYATAMNAEWTAAGKRAHKEAMDNAIDDDDETAYDALANREDAMADWLDESLRGQVAATTFLTTSEFPLTLLELPSGPTGKAEFLLFTGASMGHREVFTPSPLVSAIGAPSIAHRPHSDQTIREPEMRELLLRAVALGARGDIAGDVVNDWLTRFHGMDLQPSVVYEKPDYQNPYFFMVSENNRAIMAASDYRLIPLIRPDSARLRLTLWRAPAGTPTGQVMTTGAHLLAWAAPVQNWHEQVQRFSLADRQYHCKIISGVHLPSSSVSLKVTWTATPELLPMFDDDVAITASLMLPVGQARELLRQPDPETPGGQLILMAEATFLDSDDPTFAVPTLADLPSTFPANEAHWRPYGLTPAQVERLGTVLGEPRWFEKGLFSGFDETIDGLRPQGNAGVFGDDDDDDDTPFGQYVLPPDVTTIAAIRKWWDAEASRHYLDRHDGTVAGLRKVLAEMDFPLPADAPVQLWSLSRFYVHASPAEHAAMAARRLAELPQTLWLEITRGPLTARERLVVPVTPTITTVEWALLGEPYGSDTLTVILDKTADGQPYAQIVFNDAVDMTLRPDKPKLLWLEIDDEYEAELGRPRWALPSLRLLVAPDDAVGAEDGEVEAEGGEAEEGAVEQ